MPFCKQCKHISMVRISQSSIIVLYIYTQLSINSFIILINHHIMNIRQMLQTKKLNLNLLMQNSQKSKFQLTQIIRKDAGYFHQFLAHVGEEKVEAFLQKQSKYKEQKEQIRKLKQQIQAEELKQKYDQLNQLQIPSPLRRALVSPTCPICIEKHNWKQVVILSCGHIYHAQCIQKMINNRCAICRQQIILPGRRNVYDSYDG